MLIVDKNVLRNFRTEKRIWQGIPGIERTASGRLFATFYSGNLTEWYGNYCMIVKSDDEGATWSEPIAVSYAGEKFRCYDPCLWIDPLGRLWFIWSVMPEHAVFASVCDNPDADELNWSEPKRIGHDVMMNKPTVLSSGEWLFPIAVWNKTLSDIKIDSRSSLKRSFVYVSNDKGKSFKRLGGADVPERVYDEHMILELEDNSLLMLVRTEYGIGKSYSYDRGLTWTAGEDSKIPGPNSRFFIRRLPSGNVLMINHHNFTGRNNLTSMISRDDCKTWEGFLMLDERSSVSYPDATLADNGYIYAIYDRERGGIKDLREDNSSAAKEILVAKFTEEDVLAGRIIDKNSKLKIIVSKIL